MKEIVYTGQRAKPFESEKELKYMLCPVWNQFPTNIELLCKAIKQF